jgi:uncharacterized membrane protein
MLTRLKTFWLEASTSLWFVPGLLTLGAAALAAVAVWLPVDPAGVRWLERTSTDTGGDLLASLLTSMITMATLALSITMVVLTLAAGQLGPRLIRRFMADKLTQFMLGFFLATIVYLVLVLVVVSGKAYEIGVPQLAVTLGAGAVLVSVFLLLIFVHHLARSIVADTVIRRVGGDLDEAIERLLPESDDAPKMTDKHHPLKGGGAFSLGTGGYVQAIEYESLVECAQEAGVLVELGFRPGHHLLPRAVHGRVFPAEALTDELRHAITRCVVVEHERTPGQDLEFAMRQLVEVALRALSTGVNDPYTAIAVVDRLGLALAHVMRRGSAPVVWSDEEGAVRVAGPTTTFRGLVDVAFNQIRQAASGQPAILLRQLEALVALAELARHGEHRQVLSDHVGLVTTVGRRTIADRYDRDALDERCKAALERLRERPQ